MNDRRLGFRVPLPLMFTSYVRDRPLRTLGTDLSDTGVGLTSVAALAPAPGTMVAVELDLPGVVDSLWIAGEICYRRGDHDGAGLASGLGLRFTAMARSHARTLRDYCIESRRAHLGGLLARVRASAAAA